MEEIKQEQEVVETKTEQPQFNFTEEFAKINKALEVFSKENEALKKEILSMKSQVSVNPEPVVKKAHEINYNLWKEKF